MRRLLAVAALGGLALAGAGCSGRPVPPVAAAHPSSAPPVSRAASPYAANTHEVCAAVNAVVADGVTRFGTDVGTMAGHIAGGNQPEADKSRTAALAADPTLLAGVKTVADVPAVNQRVTAAADPLTGVCV